MYRDLIINLSLIISFLTITGHLFKDTPMSFSLKNKLIGGLIGGVLGTVLMLFSIKITDTTIMDFRNFVIIIVSLYGGVSSSIVAGVIISFSRIAFFGLNISSVTAFITFIALIIVCSVILRINTKILYKFLYMNIANIIIVYLAFLYLVDDLNKLKSIFIYYGAFSLVGGFIIFYIADYIVKSNKAYRKLKVSAEKDFLTGLNNVRKFYMVWNKASKTAQEKNEQISIILIDIDYFKNINDTYGHSTGDAVLKEVGNVLKNTARPTDTVSRNGGEEFSIILPNCSNHQAVKAAEKIRLAIKDKKFLITKDIQINLTVSIGVATYPDTTNKLEHLLDQADDCLYTAKHSGRDQVRTAKC